VLTEKKKKKKKETYKCLAFKRRSNPADVEVETGIGPVS